MMSLRKITDHVYFLPPDDVKDRPMLGYVLNGHSGLMRKEDLLNALKIR